MLFSAASWLRGGVPSCITWDEWRCCRVLREEWRRSLRLFVALLLRNVSKGACRSPGKQPASSQLFQLTPLYWDLACFGRENAAVRGELMSVPSERTLLGHPLRRRRLCWCQAAANGGGWAAFCSAWLRPSFRDKGWSVSTAESLTRAPGKLPAASTCSAGLWCCEALSAPLFQKRMQKGQARAGSSHVPGPQCWCFLPWLCWRSWAPACFTPSPRTRGVKAHRTPFPLGLGVPGASLASPSRAHGEVWCLKGIQLIPAPPKLLFSSPFPAGCPGGLRRPL